MTPIFKGFNFEHNQPTDKGEPDYRKYKHRIKRTFNRATNSLHGDCTGPAATKLGKMFPGRVDPQAYWEI